jgi:hypothetical protein
MDTVMRSVLSGLLTRVATIVGSLTLLGFILMSVTLDPGRPARVLDALLTSDAGRNVAAQVLESQVIRYDPKLTHAQATALAQRVVSDPHLPQALAVAEHGNPEATVAAVLASVKRYDPAAAAAITKYLPHTATGTPAVTLVPASVSTNLFRIRSTLATAVSAGLLIAIAVAAAAALIAPRRDRVLRRLGWWCIGASVFQVAFWVGLPKLLDRLHGQWPVLVAIAIRAAGATVAGPLVVLLLSGAGLLAAGYLGRLLRPPRLPPAGGGPRDPEVVGQSRPARGRSTNPYPSLDVYRNDPDGPRRSWTA